MTFISDFKALTGFKPLCWQVRLFDDYLSRGIVPASVDIPTGLGKTAVMALWLLARAQGATMPRRLVYVVDRRAVVDQATEFAIKLRDRLETASEALKTSLGLRERPLPISTLRGQHIDNRDWLEDPSAITVIVGTVDMIGSRLMFEGFGISRKMRPYHAGLLGADALVVLDEAHLVPPFERLLETIENKPEQFGPTGHHAETLVPPFKLLSLSATGRQRVGTVFRLEESDLDEPHLDGKPVTRLRLNAKKALTLLSTDEKDLPTRLADEAWTLSVSGQNSIRCIVYCNSRKVAEEVKGRLDNKKRGQEGNGIKTELLVGARRAFEREKAIASLKEMGFLPDSTARQNASMFLVATSAGEVGVDLDADHMVCDLVAWERMVQRLGRVNRRGEGNAQVIVLDTGEPKPAKANATTFAETRAIRQHRALHALLDALPKYKDGSSNVSPSAIRALKLCWEADDQLRLLFDDATSPAPLRPALTRALVDAWSMTSLKEHTGRPEASPWLRGWLNDEPQTAVLWRRHLPVRNNGSPVKTQEIEDFFEAAPPHASEVLETETWRVVAWLMGVAAKLLEQARNFKEQDRSSDLAPSGPEEAEDQVLMPRATLRDVDTVAFVLSAAGDRRQTYRLKDLTSEDKKTKTAIRDRLHGSLASATLILDARVAGLDSDGLLSEKHLSPSPTADDGDGWLIAATSTSIAGKTRPTCAPLIRFRVRSITDTAADPLEADKQWRERLRFAADQSPEGETLRWLVVDKWRYDAANEEDRSVGPPQSLEQHQSWAATKARQLARRIGLPEPYAHSLVIAARLHDEGKRAERWQRAFKAPRNGGPYAKTKGPCNRHLLDGYRHEFGSLRYAESDPELKSLPVELQDLVLHLIAAHHGQARPVIRTAGCEDAPPSALESRARDVALRFARLQKRWGPWGLAWWESLLRAADQQASRDNDSHQPDAQREAD